MSEIKLENLKKSFGKTDVIHDLSIDVKDGELIVIVGQSGCGKSSLGNAILQLNRATSGSVFYKGKNLHKLSKKDLISLMKLLRIKRQV